MKVEVARSLSRYYRRAMLAEKGPWWDSGKMLFRWPEQKEYERSRLLVLFGISVAERGEVTGVSECILYGKASRFEEEGTESLSAFAPARWRVLPLSIRRMVLDLKDEHSALDAGPDAPDALPRLRREPKGCDLPR